MAILITGAAGFIGFHLAKRLLEQGEKIVGLDNLNDYYEPSLKQTRLSLLGQFSSFSFLRHDLAKHPLSEAIAGSFIDTVIHLAAYAGVRYSLSHPRLYLEKNILGHLAILEWIKSHPKRPYLIYASSSSVYGGSEPPFKESELQLTPLSPYAVSKRTAELLSECYARTQGIDQTGLRFFTVYGPWGRPDMAYYKFAEAILSGKKVLVHGDGSMRRDFTYIDDIVDGILAVRRLQPSGHQIFNLGNDRPESVMDLIGALEAALGKKAALEYGPPLPGEVPITWADLTLARTRLGYAPEIKLNQGIERFSAWYKEYRPHAKLVG